MASTVIGQNSTGIDSIITLFEMDILTDEEKLQMTEQIVQKVNFEEFLSFVCSKGNESAFKYFDTMFPLFEKLFIADENDNAFILQDVLYSIMENQINSKNGNPILLEYFNSSLPDGVELFLGICSSANRHVGGFIFGHDQTILSLIKDSSLNPEQKTMFEDLVYEYYF